MGITASSIALGAGNFSAGWAIFGSCVGFFQPPLVFKLEDLGPFYDWYFPSSVKNTLSLSIQQSAVIVACLEFGAASFLLSKVIQKRPLAERKAPLVVLSAFFLYSIIGHSVVGDDLVPVASFMFLCSTSALSVIVLGKKEVDSSKGD